jgi:hypothetical protein
VVGAQAIEIVVTVLLVATSAVVFVVAIGVFVALTLHKFGRVLRSPDQPGPHETAMYLIHEPISVEDGNAIVAELNPAIDFERYGGKPMPCWPRSRRAKKKSRRACRGRARHREIARRSEPFPKRLTR